MFTQPPKYTTVGKVLHQRIMGTGVPLTFTRMQMGAGTLGARDIRDLTALINPVADITVNFVEVGAEYVVVSAPFTNTGVTEIFMWREIGLFAADPDAPDDRTKDILFCYQNAGDLAEPIPPGAQQLLERTVRLPLKHADVDQVTFSITGSTLHAELDPITGKVRMSQLPAMDYVPTSEKGTAGGVATLGNDGHVPAGQLPAMNYEAPLKSAAAKTTPVDADSVAIVDSADGSKTKRLTWANLVVAIKTALNAVYAAASHTHAWSAITGKPSTFSPSSHTHQWGEVTDKPSTYTPTSHTHPWSQVTGAPGTYAPSAHTHAQADVTGLATALAAKAALAGAAFTGNLTTVSGTATGTSSKSVRNIFVLVAVEPTASMGANGDVCIVLPK